LQSILEIQTTNIEGLLIIQPKVFGDHRGYFMETFRRDQLRDAGVLMDFVQDNQSMSAKDILRGLHFQHPPFDQGKLVQVIKGEVLDVAVDIRKNSATFGQHCAIILNEENKTMFWIPPGFAHGFLTRADDTIFSYKCTNYYRPESEGSVLWNSDSLSIGWGIKNPVLSEKDLQAPDFNKFNSPF
jgi:dTDP-4-dehydrorhamnose 3,5-epimerase